jgi:membrane protease YdiL (CAAX protease family)
MSSLAPLIGRACAALHRLTVERDPLLLQGREGRWRWPWVLVGMAMVCGLGFLLILGVFLLVGIERMQEWLLLSRDGLRLDPQWPQTFAVWLVMFVPLLVAPLLTLPLVHDVSWRRAFSYGGGFRWTQFARAAVALFIALVVLDGLSFYAEFQRYEFRWPGLDSAPWFGLAMAVIFVQSLSEEVVFKGYLLRVWGALLPFRLPIAAAVIFCFILIHIGNVDFHGIMAQPPQGRGRGFRLWQKHHT